MFVAINTDDINYNSLWAWLNNPNNEDSYYLLRDNEILDNDLFEGYYVTLQKSEQELMNHLYNDLWMCCEFDELDGKPFPFYIVDTSTKKEIHMHYLTIYAVMEYPLTSHDDIYDAINSCTYDEWQSMKVFRTYEKANDYAKEVAELDLFPDESVVIVPLLLDTRCPLPTIRGKHLNKLSAVTKKLID